MLGGLPSLTVAPPPPLSYAKADNHQRFLELVKARGVKLVNIGAEDLMAGTRSPHHPNTAIDSQEYYTELRGDADALAAALVRRPAGVGNEANARADELVAQYEVYGPKLDAAAAEVRRSLALLVPEEAGGDDGGADDGDGDPLLANFRKMAATQAKIYAAGWGAMNDTVREERGLVQSTKL